MLQVLEEREYARRKRHYKEIGQRHYYFMSVGNGEVVDACVKVQSHACAVPCLCVHLLGRTLRKPTKLSCDPPWDAHMAHKGQA